MDNAVYLALSRIAGLQKEMQAVANNVANMSTSGFRRESVLFAEMIEALPVEGGSVSMTAARVRRTDMSGGALERTGGRLDLALEGEGFFMIETPLGPRLTRSGAFALDAAGVLVTREGHPVLDPGGAPVQLPPDPGAIEIARDGSISADGRLVGAVAVVVPEAGADLKREDGVRFVYDGPLIPGRAAVFQGFVESSNVSPVAELSRLIEVQRAYELGRALLDREDERMRATLRALAPPG